LIKGDREGYKIIRDERGRGRKQLGKKTQKGCKKTQKKEKSKKRKETYFVVQALHLESSANGGGEDILMALIIGIVIKK
jgi:hypothetical protein